MKILTTTDEVQRFVERASGSPHITVDTEFMREKTYFARLCLIQVASPDEAVIIDPLAKDIDLTALFSLFRDEKTVKVFHAARQDLEIFTQLMGDVPSPLFDTQIAGMVFGYGDQVGYEHLVRDLTGQQIDKGSRFTDWSRRPLSKKQLDYALGDVTHLRQVYEQLRARLIETGRKTWIDEEMQSLSDPDLYFTKPEDAWKRLKMRSPKPREIGPAIALACWRETEAQRKDVPRSRILKDDALFELARAQPTTPAELSKLRSIPQGFERSATAKDMIAAIVKGSAIDKDDLPRLSSRSKEAAPADVVELLKVLLKKQCAEHEVAPKLLASSSDLDAIALDSDADVPALKGWRLQIFGQLALKLKRGELALSLSKKRVSIHHLDAN